MPRQWTLPGFGAIDEDGEEEYTLPGFGAFQENQPAGGPSLPWAGGQSGVDMNVVEVIPSGVVGGGSSS